MTVRNIGWGLSSQTMELWSKDDRISIVSISQPFVAPDGRFYPALAGVLSGTSSKDVVVLKGESELVEISQRVVIGVLHNAVLEPTSSYTIYKLK